MLVSNIQIRSIEFIKRLVHYILRGEASLPEESAVLISKNDTSSGNLFGWEKSSQSSDAVSHVHSATKTVMQTRQNAPRSPLRKELLIGLPPRSNVSRIRIMREKLPSLDITAEKMVARLAEKLGVNKEKWVLMVFSDNNAPYQLDGNEQIGKFLTSKTERLYFYPKAMIK